MTQFLRGQFVQAVGGMFVVIDCLQPVAAFFGPDGSHQGTCSWASVVAAPLSMHWPNRRIACVGDEVVVQELPNGDACRISVARQESSVVRDPADLKNLQWRYPKMLGTPAKGSGEWRFGTTRVRNRLTSHIDLGGSSVTRRGSLVDFAVGNERAIALVREADVRPWLLDPTHAILILDGQSGSPSATTCRPLDISGSCWPKRAEWSRLLAEYLPFTMGQVEHLYRAGAKDVSVKVTELDTRPSIDVRFRLNASGDTWLVRHDEPIDELGNLAGLAFWNVSFGEDLPLSGIDERSSHGWVHV